MRNRAALLKTAALACLMIALGYIGYNTHIRQGLELRFPPETRALFKPFNGEVDQFLENINQVKCRLVDKRFSDYTLTCIENQRPLLFLWGDSHAQALIPGLSHLRQSHPFGLMNLGASECPPMLDVKPYLFRAECDQYSHRNLELITTVQPDVLLIASAYREPRYFWTDDYFETYFSRTLDMIKQKSSNTKVIILGPTPRYKDSPQAMTLKKFQANRLQSPSEWIEAHHLKSTDEILRRQAQSHGYLAISLWELLCKEQSCLSRIGESTQDFIYFDYGHFSKNGSIYVINQIADQLATSLGTSKSSPN